MIGRGSELRRLGQLASAREPAVAIIAGEPGIGKTRLVQELLERLSPDTVVLVGQAEPGSLSRPYEVLLDAIDARPEVDAEQLAALGDPRRSPVERLHTGLAIVSDLVGDAPAVLVFEDLHWADSESAALFERIADQRGPRLLIGTYRPDEVTRRQPVAGLLARMERRHAVTHVRLDRLSPSQTAAMLAAATGAPASPGPRPRCTTAPAVTRSSWRSCCAAFPGSTRRRWSTSRCRGASPTCCAARSTTSTRSATASSRRPPCSASGSRSTCWRAWPGRPRTS
ncbi:hypothetical protein Prum_080080 [Phytohabitans rumicis]|uniref:Orc1-like AAA ATPase domain-containing protein n=2 Tax=Phytohabitans rumicis TaxID=1076125 RepID=A0A6V8LJL2_9ACTN|nr:hypothetical protein Prum_080080 [Phytohabitans rumicis]